MSAPSFKFSDTPFVFPIGRFENETQEVLKCAKRVASNLGYSYVATHYLLYSLLEYNFTHEEKLFGDFRIQIYETKLTILEIDPPSITVEKQIKMPMTSAFLDCCLYAVDLGKAHSNLATPLDLFHGFLKYRESIVDQVLSNFGIQINEGRLQSAA